MGNQETKGSLVEYTCRAGQGLDCSGKASWRRTYAEFRKFSEAEIGEEDIPGRRDSMSRDQLSLVTQICPVGTKEAEMQLHEARSR